MKPFTLFSKLMNILILAFAASSASALAFTSGSYILKSATIQYSASHPLHSFDAKSKDAAKGKIVCGDANCEILVAVPVKSFDSRNSNRDAHMIEIIKGMEFPLLSFRATLPANSNPESLTGEAEFAGKKHAMTLNKIKWEGDKKLQKVTAEGSFQLKDFGIEAPALLGVSMSQDIKLLINAEFEMR